MKIVYYTDQVYLHGGIEKVLAQKLNYFSNFSEFDVYLITTEQKNKPHCYPISKKVIHYDLGVNYIRTKSYFHPVNFKKVPSHINKLRFKLNEIKPDVLIVCNFAFDFYFIPFISKGIKTIKEYHSSRYYYSKELPSKSFLSSLFAKLNRFIEKKYTHVVVLNKDEKKYYSIKNCVVIPNSIKVATNTTKLVRNNIIIAAGRIAPVKQFDHLIKAWSLIANKFPHWEVYIYGEGDEVLSSELQQLIKELKVPNIKLMGATLHLNEKMKEASIYAMTSKTECFPMVLLESLACGLPIISYNCPFGPKNIITDKKDGVLVNHNNIDAFASELTQLIKNTELRKKMEINTKKNVERFDENIVMQLWIQLFKRIDG
ncbi:glycosyltransferase family 4 protein [Lutibacter sp.]|uniref:glycosyltransferase family 4 protein n=1 Tax=Lutibacter sp. TaxID=1925666 RepID=UPI0025BA45BE|nr:glycosyltransferase family 4 protein [Lutibacter sp.]MCF6168481.1 glycosyltransferase family 4 protein [Lutibacter sp.]